MIEQPKRHGSKEALCFMAICPGCQKLLTVESGTYPDHKGSSPELPQCPSSGRLQDTIALQRMAA